MRKSLSRILLGVVLAAVVTGLVGCPPHVSIADINKDPGRYAGKEITISGNLGQILRQIEMVGNDLTFKDATTGPTIKIAEMTIGGT